MLKMDHIVPADVVSSVGDGNTMAGMKKLSSSFPNSKGIRRRICFDIFRNEENDYSWNWITSTNDENAY